MALILTFLGQSGPAQITSAGAMARRLAAEGKRTLLAVQDATPVSATCLGEELGSTPVAVSPGLSTVQLQPTALLDRAWDEIKALESQYLRTPFLKAVFSQEMGILPGMDSALCLNAIRQYDASGDYDVIIYSGAGDLRTLRMFGLPETLDWYLRRFQAVFQRSDVGKAVLPFLQPIAATILAVDWSSGFMDESTGQVQGMLAQGRQAVHNPQRMMALLLTDGSDLSVANSRYLWGSAQQIGLTVGGVLLTNPTQPMADNAFTPLPHCPLPTLVDGDWQPLMAALPDPWDWAGNAPAPMAVDVATKTVRLFLPSFDKSQVKLTQYGPEVTIEAGGQRRNLQLPPELQGRAVSGAKFQHQHLIITFS